MSVTGILQPDHSTAFSADPGSFLLGWGQLETLTQDQLGCRGMEGVGVPKHFFPGSLHQAVFPPWPQLLLPEWPGPWTGVTSPPHLLPPTSRQRRCPARANLGATSPTLPPLCPVCFTSSNTCINDLHSIPFLEILEDFPIFLVRLRLIYSPTLLSHFIKPMRKLRPRG